MVGARAWGRGWGWGKWDRVGVRRQGRETLTAAGAREMWPEDVDQGGAHPGVVGAHVWGRSWGWGA